MIKRIFNTFDWIIIQAIAWLIIILQGISLMIVGMGKALNIFK